MLLIRVVSDLGFRVYGLGLKINLSSPKTLNPKPAEPIQSP